MDLYPKITFASPPQPPFRGFLVAISSEVLFTFRGAGVTLSSHQKSTGQVPLQLL